MMSKTLIFACILTLLGTMACLQQDDRDGGGSDDVDGSAASTQRGPSASDDDYQPSRAECTAAEQCEYHACLCTDGGIVNARSCTNGTCLAASDVCPTGCADFGTSWTGSLVSDDQDTSWEPPPTSDTPPEDPPETRYDCGLLLYSNTWEAWVQFYGTGATVAAARQGAIDQCRRADFMDWFCSSETAECWESVVGTYSCTWSNYSNDYETWVYYYGDGTTPAAAAAEAIDACLAGTWRGWFCGNGGITCE